MHIYLFHGLVRCVPFHGKDGQDLSFLTPASVFAIPQTMLQCAQNFIIVLIICIFVLTFLEPLIRDSEYGDKK